jgi:ribose 5-phosphate isomerase B
VLALSLRLTSHAELSEILDAWFEGRASADSSDRENVAHLDELEQTAAN